MSGWRTRLKQTATDLLNLPPDALLNASRVTCVNGSNVVVERAKGLTKVADDEVIVDLHQQTLIIRGTNFEVTLVTEGEVHIAGNVSSLQYLPLEQVKR